jgi:hypothetical protein
MRAATMQNIETYIAAQKIQAALQTEAAPALPAAVLANPSSHAVDLVWDAPGAELVTGYEIQWKTDASPEWHSVSLTPCTRWHLEGLEDGRTVTLKIRSLRGMQASAWSDKQACTPGAVTDSSVAGMLGKIPLWGLVKIIALSLGSLIRAQIQKQEP